MIGEILKTGGAVIATFLVDQVAREGIQKAKVAVDDYCKTSDSYYVKNYAGPVVGGALSLALTGAEFYAGKVAFHDYGDDVVKALGLE